MKSIGPLRKARAGKSFSARLKRSNIKDPYLGKYSKGNQTNKKKRRK
jgi:hypothetical protein